jgi:hypothetical protein
VQGNTPVISLSTSFPYKVLFLSTKHEVPWSGVWVSLASMYPQGDLLACHAGRDRYLRAFNFCDKTIRVSASNGAVLQNMSSFVEPGDKPLVFKTKDDKAGGRLWADTGRTIFTPGCKNCDEALSCAGCYSAKAHIHAFTHAT